MAAIITIEQPVACGWLLKFTGLLHVETKGRVKSRAPVPGLVPVNPGWTGKILQFPQPLLSVSNLTFPCPPWSR